MKTPICDFVKEYNDKNKLRLHMPGHKGKSHLGFEALDITEIPGADVLYDSDGVILESERNASSIFGTEKTLYSTEGSSLAIRAMLYLLKLYAQDKGCDSLKVLAARNAHKTFMSGASLLNIDVDFISPESSSLLSCNITPRLLEERIAELRKNEQSDLCLAVYVTSPDYLGNILDIAGLSKVCEKYGALLVVDNAHGAYLNFLESSQHPIHLGAHMCCDSAHKTLPVLTGGAYLHISKSAPKFLADQAERALQMFASTSPSYIIMQSLDMANRYIDNGYPEKLNKFVKKLSDLKVNLKKFGYTFVGDEPLKLTLLTKPYGYRGNEFAEILSRNGIECEFYDPDYVVTMLTPELTEMELRKIYDVLRNIERKESLLDREPQPRLPKAEKLMSLYEAMLKPSYECKVSCAKGKILASPSVACPPAIPILICGERIDKDAIDCFNYYGIKTVSVVKE